MKTHTKVFKNFCWKITTKPKKQVQGGIVLQEQCSCGPGGGDECHGQCGGKYESKNLMRK